jgi:hypothetical protein
MGVVDNTNGLKWDFKLDGSTTRPDQDFSWAFPTDGTPTPQVLADPTVVTYATPGSKTATLTVTNVAKTVSNKALTNNVATLTTTATHGFKVGQSVVVAGVDATFNGTYTITSTPTGTTFTYALVAANVTSAASGGTVTSDSAQYPAAGSYPITITAATGAGATTGLLMAGREGDGGDGDDGAAYDPSDKTVAEVQEDVNSMDEDQIRAVYDAEVAGKNRTTLVSYLESLLPFDPAEYNVEDVVQYASDNPELLADIITAEREGKNRSTLLSQLEALQTT